MTALGTIRWQVGVAFMGLAALALVAPMHPLGTTAVEGEDEREAAQLVERMRDAPSQYEFVGTAVVAWRVAGTSRRVAVDVHDTYGSLEVVSEGAIVFDDGRHTYLRDDAGWVGALTEPAAKHVPAPGRHWRLAAQTGPAVAGRATTLVVATRRDGSVAQRLFVDDDTGLLLGREVLDPHGRVERSVIFRDIDVGVSGTKVLMPRRVRSEAAEPLATVPSGYRAPSRPGAGYELVTRSRDRDGVHLFYSDGLFSASVFEQRGDLNWDALPKGGTTVEIAGHRTRRYTEPSGNVLVWERDGLVYTCVSDAPSDVFEQMVAGFGDTGRSVAGTIVDFVLGPFSWG